MSNSPLVSVIVPMYNVERYVGKCLKSILQQTYRNLQIIAVNDSSTDSTLLVAEKIANNDGRLQIVDLSENKGVEHARFQGLKLAEGSYITFVDSDDFLPKKSIEKLMNPVMQDANVDVVEGGVNRVMDNLGLINKKTMLQPQTINLPELWDKYYISFFGINILNVSLWGKLYKRELFSSINLKQTGLRMGEDLYVNIQIFPQIKRWVRISEIVYDYRWGGITSHYNPYFYKHQKELYRLKLEAIHKYNYFQAFNSTKIEMCNVLRSQIL